MKINMETPVQNTWCPGCPDFLILSAAKKAVSELVESKQAKHTDFVATTGIGCHGKIYDFINVGGFYGLHGRAIPVANGIVLGNPNLKVMVFAGDGDAYAEGISKELCAFTTAKSKAGRKRFPPANNISAIASS